MMIDKQLKEIKDTVLELKYKNNIKRNINIIAVSKNTNKEAITKAIEAGHSSFGESRVQDAIKKIDFIRNSTDKKIEWHFIGKLQTNKIRKALRFFDFIHSIDSSHTANALDKECKLQDRIIDAFVQVNTTGEEQKAGIYKNDLPFLLEDISTLSNVRVIGLMTISMLTDDKGQIRRSFALLRELKDEVRIKFSNMPLDFLSMGMSRDYDMAILEGATHIRIGSAIFKENL